MRRVKITIAALCILVSAQSVFAQSGIKLENERDSASYALGVILGSQLKQTKVDSLNYDAMVKAIVDYYSGTDSLKIDMETAREIYENFLRAIARAEGQKNLEEGQKFLAQNAAKPGVKTTESGLQYKVIKEGTGPSPTAQDRVVTHYTGKLINGKIFDSSVERGQPATFGVSQVIPGWTEALQMMKVGSKWELYVPSNLAYGARDNRSIPANSVLIFEVELLAIEGDNETGQ